MIKNLLRALGFVAGLFVLGLIILITWMKIIPDHVNHELDVSHELDVNYMRCSVMGQAIDGTVEALRQFKKENGYLPLEDNPSVTAALLGKNKTGKNYIPNWGDGVANGQILDIDHKPLVFHFINDNEITIYASATKQLYDVFLDSDQGTVIQAPNGNQK